MSTSMTCSGHEHIHSDKHRTRHTPGPTLGINLKFLRAWRARYRNRRALRHEFGRASPQWLAHIEQDIGLEPGSLQQEMHKPFWAE